MGDSVIGSNVNLSQLSSGLNIIQYNPAAGKPEPIQLTQTPKEVFEEMILKNIA